MSDVRTARAMVAALAVGVRSTDAQVLRALRQLQSQEITLADLEVLARDAFDGGVLRAAASAGVVLAVDLDGRITYAAGHEVEMPLGYSLVSNCRALGASALAQALEEALEEARHTKRMPGQPFEVAPLLLRGDVVGAVAVRL